MDKTEKNQTTVKDKNKALDTETVKDSTSKRDWRFYLKIFSVLFLFTLAAVGIAVFYCLNKLTSDSNFEKLVNKKVSEAINMDVTFEKIGISFPSIELSNIQIATDSTEIKLDSKITSVRLRPDFFSALKGNLIIDYLNISSSTTLLTIKDTKKHDKTKGNQEKPFETSFKDSIFPFKSVDITGINLSCTEAATNKKYDVKLNRASISHSVISSALPYELDLEWPQKAYLHMEGDLHWLTKVTSNIALRIKNINDFKDLIPDNYHDYIKDVSATNLKASIDYDIEKNSIEINKCDGALEPFLNLSGVAKLSQLSPLKLQAKVNVASNQVTQIWSIVKNFLPNEYGLSLRGGTLGAEIKIGLDGDKPVQLSVLAIPNEVNIKNNYMKDEIRLKKANIAYGDDKRVKISDLEATLANSSIKLKSFALSTEDLSLDSAFTATINIDGILRNAQKHLSEPMKRLSLSGNAALEATLKGNLSDIASIKANGTLTSKQITLKEKTVSAKGKIEDLNIKFDNIGRESGDVVIESLKANAVGASVNVSGKIKNKKDIGIDCLAKGSINIAEFSKLAAGLFRLPVKSEQYKGNIDLELKVTGSVEDTKTKGNLIAKDLYADLSQYGLVIDKLNGTAIADENKLILNDIRARVLGGELDLKGTLRDFKDMRLEAVANIKGSDLALIKKLILAWVPDLSPELDFNGKADLNASLKGSTSEPILKGSAQLVDANFFHPSVFRPVEKINGRINFSNAGLDSENLTAFWGTSKAKLSGNLKDWSKFITDFKFEVANLDVTDISNFFLGDSGYNILGMGIGSGTVTGAIENIKVGCQARVDVGTVTAIVSEGGDSMKFPYKSFVANAVYTENILNIASASLKLFDGDVDASGKVYLATEPIRYDFKTSLSQIQTQEFLRANADKKYEKTIVGGVDGLAEISGDVTGLSSINGKARLSLASGTYDSPDIIKKVADSIKNPSLASGTIENLSGDYTVKSGRVFSDNLIGTSRDNTVAYRGSIGLDTTLDGSIVLTLGKETCAKSGYLRELLGNSDSINLSCQVKGSLTSPEINMPLDTLAKQRAKNEIDKALDKSNLNRDKIKEEASKAVSKIGRSLKKIFK